MVAHKERGGSLSDFKVVPFACWRVLSLSALFLPPVALVSLSFSLFLSPSLSLALSRTLSLGFTLCLPARTWHDARVSQGAAAARRLCAQDLVLSLPDSQLSGT